MPLSHRVAAALPGRRPLRAGRCHGGLRRAAHTQAGARPRRSALYMPGSRRRALEKARTLDADCIIMDLEDAVAPDAKVGFGRIVASEIELPNTLANMV